MGVTGGKFRRVPGGGWSNLRDLRSLALNIRELFLIGMGVLYSLWVLGRFNPDVVFNKAGPVGLPVGLAAHILRIPMVIHEPDVIPGLGNKLLSRWATTIAVGFPKELYKDFPKGKLVYTGTPVRSAILTGDPDRGRAHFGFTDGPPVVLIVGGSQGAVALNEAIAAIAPGLLQQAHIHHISGHRNFDKVNQVAVSISSQTDNLYRVDPFLDVDDMAAAYAAADVVVARAGASTIAELAGTHKAVVLVPNRLAAAHQAANAEALGKREAAIVATEQADEINTAINRLLESKAARDKLEKAIQAFNRPDAAELLAKAIVEAQERR